MKFIFENEDEYMTLWQSVHDSIILWKKRLQECQGKINMQVDGSKTHYDEKYCIDEMVRCAGVLRDIEDSPHPEWNDKTNTYEVVDGVDYYSTIITKTLRQGGARYD